MEDSIENNNIFHISGEPYRKVAFEVNKNPKYKDLSADQYRRGAKNSDNDPTRIERQGKLGELAWAFLTNQIEQFQIKETYRKYDFIEPNTKKKIDVKTTELSDRFLIKTDLGINADIYPVFRVISDDTENHEIVFEALGYFTKEDIDPNLTQKGKGDWLNYVIPRSKFKPIDDFIVD